MTSIPDELLPIEHVRDAGDGCPSMRLRTSDEIEESLSDLSVLVQIPAVRELAELLQTFGAGRKMSEFSVNDVIIARDKWALALDETR